ncbi:pilus assembly protein [Phenylobacterium sp. LjRoot225]|uniref:TadE/TadG family type IV pilus assembly protein n=1 Tax=Phenylobacterium sp. LjRoot225 TaxID=3342285 RepID=UPI003ED04B1F
MNLIANLRQFRRDHSGAALVEFTILAPLLISLMCGLAEFGQVLRQYHIMEKGVRDAARYLSRVPANPPCTGIADPNWGTYVAQARNLAVYGVTSTGTPLFNGWTNTATVSVPDPPCLANPRVNGADLPRITVTATAPYADLGLLSVLGVGPLTLTVSHEQLKVS